MNKKQAYQEKISPLMKQIVTICKEHGIAMIALFSIPTEDMKNLLVMTSITDEAGKIPEFHKKVVDALLLEEQVAMSQRKDH